MVTKAEIGVMQLQAQERHRLPASPTKEEARKDSPKGFRESKALLMP